jgi:3',5'-cyclic AMP phosphodiesterase CpdA
MTTDQSSLRIAVTADLHWGHNALGDQATQLLLERLTAHPPDLFLLGGDVGASAHFAACLDLFCELPCPRALVPGNHDLWVEANDPRGDSLRVYEEHLPEVCRDKGFHYLDHGLLALPQLTVVGSINWYDYSWSLERLQNEVADWQWRLENMAFTRGRHNDRRFVRWPLDDVRFTRHVVARLEQQLGEATQSERPILVLTHHPAFYGLSFPRVGPPSVPDGLLWDAFSGNAALEALLVRHAERIRFVLSGHTHRARESSLGPIRGINIGGDYRWKRLVEIDWSRDSVEYHEFGVAT